MLLVVHETEDIILLRLVCRRHSVTVSYIKLMKFN